MLYIIFCFVLGNVKRFRVGGETTFIIENVFNPIMLSLYTILFFVKHNTNSKLTNKTDGHMRGSTKKSVEVARRIKMRQI